jgi:hypothetical protein
VVSSNWAQRVSWTKAIAYYPRVTEEEEKSLSHAQCTGHLRVFAPGKYFRESMLTGKVTRSSTQVGSGSLSSSVREEEEKFYEIETCGQCYKTFYGRKL